MSMPKKGDIRVSHIPQVPGPAFSVDVKTPGEGRLLMTALANYDLFQFENMIKPDYCNAQFMEIFDGEEWVDYDEHIEEFPPETIQGILDAGER